MLSINNLEDVELVEKTKAGNKQAYSVLVQRYEALIRACLRVRLNNTHEAEDLAQDTFIVAYDKIQQFQHGASFSAWLRGIAVNLLRNHQRKHTPISIGGSQDLENLIELQIEQDYQSDNEALLITHLNLCMDKLDEKMRTLLTEHFHQGYSLSELSRKYSIGHSTMTMRMYRLRQNLKNCIENKSKH